MRRYKNLLALAVAAVVTTSVGYIDKAIAEQGLNESDLNAALLEASNNLNQNLPRMLDAETRLDTSIVYKRNFIYRHTLVNLSAEEIDEETNDEERERIANTVCTTKGMQVFFINNVTVTYSYYGKNGKHITDIVVTPERCRSS